MEIHLASRSPRHRITGLLLVSLAFSIVVAAPAQADRCTGAKVKAIGKKESGLLACQAKVAKSNDSSGLVDCQTKVITKFNAAFTKAGTCAGPTGTCETIADGCEAAVVAAFTETLPSDCEAAKRKAAGKLAKAELGCYAKATAKGLPVDTVKCLPKATAKFAAALVKAGTCPDGGSPQSLVENNCVTPAVTTDGAGFVTAICSEVLCPDTTPPDVCARWTADLADVAEGAWTGSVGTCTAGSIPASGIANYVKLTNLYRALAGLSAVTDDPSRDAKSQQCALMMQANGALNHTPPPSWTCYTSDGALAAGKSDLAEVTPSFADALDPMALWMVDVGNPTTLGHRRWILNRRLGPIGIGSTNSFACLWVLDGTATPCANWTAWPPAGQVPIQALSDRFGNTVDDTGWSLQSDTIDLSAATVTVTDGVTPMPVTVSVLLSGYGSKWAIAFVPNAWTTQVGHTYAVHVTNAAVPIDYTVEVLNCP